MFVEWIKLPDPVPHFNISPSFLSPEMLGMAIVLLLAGSYLVITGSEKHTQIKKGLIVVRAGHPPTVWLREDTKATSYQLPLLFDLKWNFALLLEEKNTL